MSDEKKTPVVEKKEPTLVDEINELEKEYLELDKEIIEHEKKLASLKDKHFDILKRLAPRQTAFLKAIINDQQTKLKDAEKPAEVKQVARASNVL